MELKRAMTIKGWDSAVVLTGFVLFTVATTQSETSPKTVAQPSPVNTPKVAIEQRNYTPRENVSSRADKPVRLAIPAKPTTDFTYTVQQGDTLYDLANSSSVSVGQIMAANGLDSEDLSLNQKLLIPVSGKVKIVKKAVQAPIAKKRPVVKEVSRSRYPGRAVGELVAWSKAQNMFGIGSVVTVIDVNTGYTFKIKRKGGHNHADCEPLTASDTAVMKKFYGSWSWDRRAIVVVAGDQKIAASMAGMPHGSHTISGNGFSGHFDVHFYKSMTHGSEYTHSRTPMVDPDHQAMVRKAAGR